MHATQLTIFFDGACPICRGEVRALRACDRRKVLAFVDIATEGFDACPPGTDLAALNARIHAVTGDGKVLTGLDTLLAAYNAIGLGWAVLPLRVRTLRPVLDWGYRHFANNRHHISRVLGLQCVGACRPFAPGERSHGGN